MGWWANCSMGDPLGDPRQLPLPLFLLQDSSFSYKEQNLTAQGWEGLLEVNTVKSKK